MFLTYKEQLEDPRWIAKRHEVKEYYGFKCQKCGATNVPLEAHHPVYRPGRMAWEYAVTELMCLCHECHYIEHHKEEIENELRMERESKKEDLRELRKEREWLLALPIGKFYTINEKRKTIDISLMTVKTKKNALNLFDTNKQLYLLIGSVPGSKCIDFICRTTIKFTDDVFRSIDNRVYDGDFYLPDPKEYRYRIYDFLENDDTNRKSIVELSKELEYSLSYLEDKPYVYNSCLVQSDKELKTIYKADELKTFPHCICMNV